MNFLHVLLDDKYSDDVTIRTPITALTDNFLPHTNDIEKNKIFFLITVVMKLTSLIVTALNPEVSEIQVRLQPDSIQRGTNNQRVFGKHIKSIIFSCYYVIEPIQENGVHNRR